MCKNRTNQRRCIETAKLETPEVYAIYENVDAIDLVGIVKVHERTQATLCDVDRHGNATSFQSVPVWRRPNNRQIARMFGLTHCYRVRRV